MGRSRSNCFTKCFSKRSAGVPYDFDRKRVAAATTTPSSAGRDGRERSASTALARSMSPASISRFAVARSSASASSGSATGVDLASRIVDCVGDSPIATEAVFSASHAISVDDGRSLSDVFKSRLPDPSATRHGKDEVPCSRGVSRSSVRSGPPREILRVGGVGSRR